MPIRNFNEWTSHFRDSINGYDYYIDFNKVYENVEKVRIEINILNSLIGRQNIEEEFENILRRYPECLKVIPILLAVRKYEIFCTDNNGEVIYNFDTQNLTIEEYKYFMDKTGLFELLKNHVVNSLIDYITGVEVGLNTNARKNRGGKQMENLVESYIRATGKEYYSHMSATNVERKWGLDLSSISYDGNTEKVWDFVVATDNTIYVIETNFYTDTGSKQSETARSYKKIAEESEEIEGLKFVWITDGKGWDNSARNNLKETFDILDNLYNINDLENGALNNLFNI